MRFVLWEFRDYVRSQPLPKQSPLLLFFGQKDLAQGKKAHCDKLYGNVFSHYYRICSRAPSSGFSHWFLRPIEGRIDLVQPKEKLELSALKDLEMSNERILKNYTLYFILCTYETLLGV